MKETSFMVNPRSICRGRERGVIQTDREGPLFWGEIGEGGLFTFIYKLDTYM